MSGDGVSGAHLCSETYVSHPGQVRKKEHTCVEVQQSATGGRGDIGYEICWICLVCCFAINAPKRLVLFLFFIFYFNGIRDIIFGRDALIRKGWRFQDSNARCRILFFYYYYLQYGFSIRWVIYRIVKRHSGRTKSFEIYDRFLLREPKIEWVNSIGMFC